MNAALVKSPPPGDLASISALNTGWHFQLHSLIHQKRPVNLDYIPLRKFK